MEARSFDSFCWAVVARFLLVALGKGCILDSVSYLWLSRE